MNCSAQQMGMLSNWVNETNSDDVYFQSDLDNMEYSRLSKLESGELRLTMQVVANKHKTNDGLTPFVLSAQRVHIQGDKGSQ